jgi:hypothetical protein
MYATKAAACAGVPDKVDRNSADRVQFVEQSAVLVRAHRRGLGAARIAEDGDPDPFRRCRKTRVEGVLLGIEGAFGVVGPEEVGPEEAKG